MYDGLVWNRVSCISSKLSEQKSRFASGAGEVLRAGARNEESLPECQRRGARAKRSLSE